VCRSTCDEETNVSQDHPFSPHAPPSLVWIRTLILGYSRHQRATRPRNSPHVLRNLNSNSRVGFRHRTRFKHNKPPRLRYRQQFVPALGKHPLSKWYCHRRAVSNGEAHGLLGHTIVLSTIPVGTLLYHGTYKREVPSKPGWIAMDPEHSYMFCQSQPTGARADTDQKPAGCWHLTLTTTRPLKVLYFDGSSAANMEGGPMDSQDILLWGEIKPEWTFQERKRIDELCKWGKELGLDGFVRCVLQIVDHGETKENMYLKNGDGLVRCPINSTTYFLTETQPPAK
jgi:hypothetical protein